MVRLKKNNGCIADEIVSVSLKWKERRVDLPIWVAGGELGGVGVQATLKCKTPPIEDIMLEGQRWPEAGVKQGE